MRAIVSLLMTPLRRTRHSLRLACTTAAAVSVHVASPVLGQEVKEEPVPATSEAPFKLNLPEWNPDPEDLPPELRPLDVVRPLLPGRCGEAVRRAGGADRAAREARADGGEAPTTDGNSVTGTLPYVAPERAAGDWAKVDHRADIWALGATLYEAMTLQRAYPRAARDVLTDITTKDPTPPKALRRDIPRELQRICLTAMQRDPEQRYQTWESLAGDLRAWIRQSRRRRASMSIAGGGSLVAAAALMLGVAIWKAGEPLPEWPGASGVESHAHRAAGDAADERHDVQSRSANFELDTDPDGHESVVASPPPSGASATLTAATASAPAPAGVLIAVNEDLNISDDLPPRAGGVAERILRRALEKAEIPLRDAADNPATWDIAAALQAARDAGVAALLYGEMSARVKGKVTGLEYGDATAYRWELRLELRLVRLSDERVVRITAEPAEVVTPANPAEQWAGQWEGSPDRLRETVTSEIRTVAAPGEFGGGDEPLRRVASRAAADATEQLKVLLDYR